jgi:DNA-binding GntR family transcriptional regulator
MAIGSDNRRRRVGAELAGRQTARRLQIRPHMAVLVLSRLRYDAGGQLRHHSQFTINPAVYEVTLTTDPLQSRKAPLQAVAD